MSMNSYNQQGGNMIKVYGIPLSNNLNKVRYCLDYLKLSYEVVSVNPMEKQTQTAEYKKISPTGKIPALSDGDFNIFESDSIIRYLAERENSALYPKDLKKRTTANSWMDFTSIHIGNSIGRVLFNRLFAPMMGAPVDENSLKFGLEMLDKYLPLLNSELAKTKYIAGSEMTIADISLLAALDPLELIKIDLTPYKELNAWRNNLKSQSFYQPASQECQKFIQSMMAGK
jgi:glutathione S-transferase